MNHLNETGIYNNVAGFEKLIAYCQGFGDKYNPGADDLNLLSLVNYHANYATAENRANTGKVNYENAINERKNVFDSLKVLSTSIMNLMKTYNADPLKIKDMEAYHRKIQGKRATAIPQDATEDKDAQTADPGNTGMNEEAGRKKTRSVSQQSYDSLINHFEKMLITISTEAGYTPPRTRTDYRRFTTQAERT